MPDLRRYAWLSIAAAVVTIGLKGGAYAATGSVGLLSDALESLVNLAAAAFALVSLTVAARPPDADHAYGHSKAEYFAAGLEGGLILVAAASIAYAAGARLLDPRPIESAGVGVAIALVASGVNFGVARVLARAGRAAGSPTLLADAEHLMTDVWSSIAVVVGVVVVAATGWTVLDPLLGLAVAVVIVRTGVRLVRGAAGGLMDPVLPEAEAARLRAVLDGYLGQGVEYHALRTRQSGARRFVSVHVLVPPEWTVQRGHDVLERIEADLRAAVPALAVFTHLEPIGDPTALDDIPLHRGE